MYGSEEWPEGEGQELCGAGRMGDAEQVDGERSPGAGQNAFEEERHRSRQERHRMRHRIRRVRHRIRRVRHRIRRVRHRIREEEWDQTRDEEQNQPREGWGSRQHEGVADSL